MSDGGDVEIIETYYKVTRVLGMGSFGRVVEAIDMRTNRYVAIKTEAKDAEYPQLLYEYRAMEEMRGSEGIPECIYFGYDDVQNILIMERLNMSLEQLRKREGGKLPLPYMLQIGRLGLLRLQTVHNAGFAHRDIKPDNFMLRHDTLYIIDFGLCKKLVDPRSGRHIPQKTDKCLAGTPRYASIRAHRGFEQSRRDDLEAFMYMCIYLVNGQLPWQRTENGPPVDILECKVRIHPEDLCEGLPPCFLKTLVYARSLPFEDLPDYSYLTSLWSACVRGDYMG
jgi:serine/threonine protein kinase